MKLTDLKSTAHFITELFSDFVSLISFVIKKCQGHTVSWQGRRVCISLLNLFQKSDLSEKEQQQMTFLVCKIIDHKQDYDFWGSSLFKGNKSQSYLLLNKLMKSLDCLDKLDSFKNLSDLEHLSKLLPSTDLLKQDLKIRILCLAIFKYQDHFNQLKSHLKQTNLTSQRLQSMARIIDEKALSVKIPKLVMNNLNNPRWNYRQCFFLSIEANQKFHPNHTDIVNALSYKLGMRYQHTSMVFPKTNQTPMQVHMAWSDHQIESIPPAAFLTSDFLELNAEKLVSASALKCLRAIYKRPDSDIIQFLNARLEKEIGLIHEYAAKLKLINYNNAMRVVAANLQNSIYADQKHVDQIFKMKEGQNIHCAEYCLIVFNRAVKQLNFKLNKEFGCKNVTFLKLPCEESTYPSANRPDEAFKILSSVCDNLCSP